MDAKLIEELREHHVMPLELDTTLQDFYTKCGVDWTQVETHFSPGAPKEQIDLHEQTEDMVRGLYKLEFEGQEGTPEYQRLETQIKELLQGLKRSQICRYSNNLTRIINTLPAETGTGGYVRDSRAMNP
ncbi:hypothetical protein CEE44_04935 [Candidatus Woesearchaeota archaeon B3_Woes]|nr:MAG: hypothetical protein CEE44_04935 [Candidatus Woesearchaeota archaeon B3_Woes]